MSRGKSITKLLLDSSEAALFAAIEIHNKPHVDYRYSTSVILLINAWELALKAYVYKYVGRKHIYEKDGIHTKSFTTVLTITRDNINAREKNQKFQSVYKNLDLLNNYRNSNVHFIEGELDPVVFMLMSKAVLNYDTFLKKYFRKDITKDDNLIILPIGMKLPFDPVDYLKQDYGAAHNDFVNKVVQSVRELSENGIQDSIVVGFDVYADRIKDSKNADIIATLEANPDAVALRKAIRVTDDPNAPAMRLQPDLLPLTYNDIRIRVKEKRPDMKYGKAFNIAMSKVKKDRILCQTNYLDPKTKKGAKKDFYSEKAVDVVLKYYDEISQ